MRGTLTILLVNLVACSSSGGDDTGIDAGSNRGGGPVAAGPFFQKPMFFDTDVSTAPVAGNSGAILSSLRAAGGWGNGDKFQIDFSINVLGADAATPHKAFAKGADWADPDCDVADVPIPDGGNVEGNGGYACADGGDCHLLVMDEAAHTLYELWEASIESSGSGATFTASCLAKWDTSIAYTNTLRGAQCTSADAAGFPMAPMLFTADEVAAGSIDHAIRFILPNDRLQQGYVAPATHGTRTSGGADAPFYGFQLRLRADFDLASLPSDGARVVAKALQKYGMYQADGGNIALTGRDDRGSTAKWADVLDSHDLASLKVEDFEVIDNGPEIPLTLDCAR